MTYRLREIAEAAGGTVVGDPDTEVTGISSPDQASETDLVFAGDPEWLARAEGSAAAAILAPKGSSSTKPLVLVDDVRNALQHLLPLFEGDFRPPVGVHPLAFVHPEAHLAQGVRVGPFACVMAKARMAEDVVLHPFAYVGEGCSIGPGTELFPRATLMPGTRVGSRCRLHAGCVIGEAGFGYRFEAGAHQRIPQVGHVEIGDDCDIGANVTVDRAMVGFTVIGPGTKVDNLVQIGHNVRIGANCIIVSQTGISGSCEIGDGVVLGGQTGVSDHVRIGPGVRTGGQTGVAASITEPGDYWGTPARPRRETLRTMAAAARVPELIKELRALRARVEELEKQSG
ncbi:MAG: UDP-3-O-acylglucosamine N-acyltransferase [Fimbriimonadales bacterium]